MSELDLSGKADPEQEAPAKQGPPKGAKGRGGASAAATYTRPDRAERAWEKDIRERAERTQARVIEWLEGRQDTELATVFKEDGAAMIGGFIATARSVTWLRSGAVAFLTVAEPALAFGRLFKVLLSRLGERRAARQEQLEADAAAAQAEQEAEEARRAGGLGPR